MNIKKTSEINEKLLHRKSVFLEVEFESSTPSNEIIQKEVAVKLNVNPDLIKIKKIDQGYGERKANINAYLYTDKENLEKIENKNKRKKKEAKKESK